MGYRGSGREMQIFAIADPITDYRSPIATAKKNRHPFRNGGFLNVTGRRDYLSGTVLIVCRTRLEILYGSP